MRSSLLRNWSILTSSNVRGNLCVYVCALCCVCVCVLSVFAANLTSALTLLFLFVFQITNTSSILHPRHRHLPAPRPAALPERRTMGQEVEVERLPMQLLQPKKEGRTCTL